MASAAAAKKWPRLFQCWACVGVHQPQVGLVDQGGGLERLARLLLGQPLRRQLAQLVVDQRQELLGGVRVALLDGGQDARDVAHEVKHNRRREDRPALGCESSGGGSATCFHRTLTPQVSGKSSNTPEKAGLIQQHSTS